MEWLIDLGLMLIVVFATVKGKFVSVNLKKPILIPIKIRNTNTEQYKKLGNRDC